AAASLANHVVVRERLPVGLLTAAHDPLVGERARFALPPRPERAQLLHLLEILARVEVAPGNDFVALLRRARATLSWGATIAVITGREGDDLRDALLGLRRGGFAVALILVQPDPAPSGGLDLPGVPVQRLWSVGDLERGR